MSATRRMRIYLAGPMRGIPQWNYPAFDASEARWRAAGHFPMSPAAISRALGYCLTNGEDPTNVSQDKLRHMMQLDIVCLFSCDAISLLPGWELSTGATVELALANFLGLKVYDDTSMQEFRPTAKPWRIHAALHARQLGQPPPVAEDHSQCPQGHHRMMDGSCDNTFVQWCQCDCDYCRARRQTVKDTLEHAHRIAPTQE